MASQPPVIELFVQQFTQTAYQIPTSLAFCEGNPPVTGGFPSQMASVESVSMS